MKIQPSTLTETKYTIEKHIIINQNKEKFSFSGSLYTKLNNKWILIKYITCSDYDNFDEVLKRLKKLKKSWINLPKRDKETHLYFTLMKIIKLA